MTLWVRFPENLIVATDTRIRQAQTVAVSTLDSESRPSSPVGAKRSAAVEVERALPDIRTRLTTRYGDLGTAAVDDCLSAAVEASASFRLQEFRSILVERQADRNLRRLREKRASLG